MKRALIKQMAAEWRTNIWLIIEMALVLLAIWTILFTIWNNSKGFIEPRGFSPEDVYEITVKTLNTESPDYIKEYDEYYFQDRDELIKRLKENPNVEYVSLHNNMMPYTLDFSGNLIDIARNPDTIEYYANIRKAQPDIIRILDIQSLTGKSQDELVKMLERGEVLLSHTPHFEEPYGDVMNFIGKTASFYDLETPAKIGDIVRNIRRTDYEPAISGMIIYPYNPNQPSWGDIALKVKPGRDKAFEEDFKKDRSLTHLRNVYLSDLHKLTDMGEIVNSPQKKDNRLRIGISLFLLITIFLGLLGSFWFRVQQRTSEIAIRKTFGASAKVLFQRLISEGLILLFTGIILSSACVWPFITKIEEFTGEKWYAVLVIEGVTVGIMALWVVVSLFYPAWRAMKIEPAIAVKEE